MIKLLLANVTQKRLVLLNGLHSPPALCRTYLSIITCDSNKSSFASQSYAPSNHAQGRATHCKVSYLSGLTGPDSRTHRRAYLTDIFREELQSLREKLLLVTQQSELQLAQCQNNKCKYREVHKIKYFVCERDVYPLRMG